MPQLNASWFRKLTSVVASNMIQFNREISKTHIISLSLTVS